MGQKINPFIESYKQNQQVLEAVREISNALMQKYDQLLIDNNLNPEFYEPEISVGGNGFVMSAIPCQIINGQKIKLKRNG